MSAQESDPVRAWHTMLASDDPDLIAPLLEREVTFRSPAVHRPKQGATTVVGFLAAAQRVIGPTVEFGRVWRLADRGAVLEFEATVSDLDVHGVDILTWDEEGRITDITVMVRPLKALDALSRAMGVALARVEPTH